MLHLLHVVKSDAEDEVEERLKWSCRNFLIGSAGRVEDVKGVRLLLIGDRTEVEVEDGDGRASARRERPVERSGSGRGFGVKNARNVDCEEGGTAAEPLTTEGLIPTSMDLETVVWTAIGLGLKGDRKDSAGSFLTHLNPPSTLLSRIFTASSSTGDELRIWTRFSKGPSPLSDDGNADDPSLERIESDRVRGGGERMGKSGASLFLPYVRKAVGRRGGGVVGTSMSD